MISAAALLLLAQAATASPAASPAAVPSPRPTPSGPVVVLETSMGRIRIGLYDDKSPVSTENFLKYVRKGHYNGTLFHRVMPNFMIQGGGMTPDLTEKPTDAPIRNEARTNGLRLVVSRSFQSSTLASCTARTVTVRPNADETTSFRTGKCFSMFCTWKGNLRPNVTDVSSAAMISQPLFIKAPRGTRRERAAS